MCTRRPEILIAYAKSQILVNEALKSRGDAMSAFPRHFWVSDHRHRNFAISWVLP